MSVERYLDSVFSQSAKDQLNYQRGKLFEYRLLNDNYQPIRTGKCHVINRRYMRSIDCDMITIDDIETGDKIVEHQFKLDLYEIKE